MSEKRPVRPEGIGARAVPKKGSPKAPANGPSELDAFLEQVEQTPRLPEAARGQGRLIFALDATLSRQPTWDLAMALQSDMFETARSVGGLEIQLVWFRGRGEFHASAWHRDAGALGRDMTGLTCRGGRTQMARVLAHTETEARRSPVRAVVYIGDACEENADLLCETAGRIGVCGTKVFLFQEGGDPTVTAVFKEIARLTGGATAPFNSSAPGQLRSLLVAVAAWAAGGRKALAQLGRDHAPAVALLEKCL